MSDRDVGALPTFFIIGAGKAGTTSLHSYLDRHPRIAMSTVKEPNFLSGPPGDLPYPTRRVATLAEYRRLFDPSCPVRGEASPSYTNFPRRTSVPERIAELVPEARFVYLVRDPVERAISHFSHAVAVGEERRDLDMALAEIDDPSCYFVCQSRYATQLRLYLERFPANRMLIVEQDDLRSRRRETLRRIFEFLEVDATFDSPHFDDELYRSSERRAYSRRYSRLVEAGAASRIVRAVPSGLRHRARNSVERILWPKVEQPAADDRVKEALAEILAPEAEVLRGLTGMRFASWSV